MREGAKKRLLGAVVVVALAVIFVPMLFESPSLDSLPSSQPAIPPPPAFNPGAKTEVFLRPQDSGAGGPAGTVSQPLALPPVGDVAPVPIGATGGGNAAKPSAGAAAKPTLDPAADKTGKAPVKSTATPEPVPARGANGGQPSWVIQVASVTTREAADAQCDKLRAGGFTAFVEEAQVNGKTAYRVQVGPELERARADQTAARLREKQKVNPLIRSYP